jgi:hypothetical protein
MPIPPIEARPRQATKNTTTPVESRRYQQLATMVAPLIPDWSVEFHRDELGEWAIVIMPDDADDAVYPTLIVHTDGSVFHLDELRQDTFRKLSEHPTWTELLRAVRIRLTWEVPISATLH